MVLHKAIKILGKINEMRYDDVTIRYEGLFDMVKVISEYKQQHPRSYERNRGRDGSKAMSYYLPDDILELLHQKSKREKISKSELVLEGLKYILREEITQTQPKSSN